MPGIAVTARTALITGSSRGIGRGIALKLAACGIGRIGVHCLKNRDAAEETARFLRECGAERVLLQADVTGQRISRACSPRRGRVSAPRSASSSPTPGPM